MRAHRPLWDARPVDVACDPGGQRHGIGANSSRAAAHSTRRRSLVGGSPRGATARQLHDRLSATAPGGVARGLRARGKRQDRAAALVAGRGSASGRRGCRSTAARRTRSASGCRSSTSSCVRSARDGCGRARQPLARVQRRGGGRAAAVGSRRRSTDPVVLVDRRSPRAALPRGARPARAFLTQLPPTVRVVLATREEPRLGLHRAAPGGRPHRAARPRICASARRRRASCSRRPGSRSPTRAWRCSASGPRAGPPVLRLAALSLAGHPEPERFVREFSGSERTVAGYLLAEVLERQPPEVRELLLRTSLLDRVSGPLADFLTGGSGSRADPAEPRGRERVRHAARRGPVVVPLPPAVRRPPPARAAAHRPADHRLAAPRGRASGTRRTATSSRRSGTHRRQRTGRQPPGCSPTTTSSLILDGRIATVRALLAAFPPDALEANAELPVLLAGARRVRRPARRGGRVPRRRPAARRHRHRRAQAALRPAVRDGAASGWPRAAATSARAVGRGARRRRGVRGADGRRHRTPARSIGSRRCSTSASRSCGRLRLDESRHHLEQALALARRIGRPYLEIVCLAFLAIGATLSDLPLSVARRLADDAVAIADEHGWGRDPVAAPAFVVAGSDARVGGPLRRGRAPARARAPGAARGRRPAHRADHRARHGPAASRRRGGSRRRWRPSARPSGCRRASSEQHPFTLDLRSRILRTQVQMGETAAARAALAEMDEQTRARAGMRITAAAIELAEGRPGGGGRRARAGDRPLGAGAPSALGDDRGAAVRRRGPRADGRPARRGGRRSSTRSRSPSPRASSCPSRSPRSAACSSAIRATAPPTRRCSPTSSTCSRAAAAPRRDELAPSAHELSDAELRVVRYLPTNLNAPAIASELFLSPNTVRTHLRHIYAKLGAHSRSEAVARARELGLLAPSLRLR